VVSVVVAREGERVLERDRGERCLRHRKEV